MRPRRSRTRRLWTLGVTAAALTLSCTPPYPSPPPTKRVEVVDTIHGVAIADPYRWLEDQDAAETRQWIDAQNAYAEKVVGESPLRDALRARLRELMAPAEIDSPKRGGDVEFFTMRRPDQELPVIYRRPAPSKGHPEPIDPQGDYEVVIDPHPMSADHTTRVHLLAVSPGGRHLIYVVREGGQDEVEVRVRDVESGKDLPERLERGLYSSVSFNTVGTGFYYTRRSRETGPRVYFHEMGTPVAEDRVLFGEGHPPTSFINVSEVGDGHYLLFTVNHGWAWSELHVQDLKKKTPVEPLTEEIEAHFQAKFHEGLLYVRTDWGAPNYRLVSIDLGRPDREHWREILPESDDVLQDFTFVDDKLYVTALHNVGSRIKAYTLDGKPLGEIPLPEHHRGRIRAGAKDKALLTLSSFTQPPITYELDLKTGERKLWEKRDVPFSAEGIEVQQVWVTSKDQTKVPMYVVHREGLEMDGRRPTMLYGYGGFNVAQTPRFDVMGAVWVERGGVFALACLRGGSEFGERWHRAGMLENKQNVFDDFISSAEWLIAKGITRREKLAIRGASNGGLLVGAALTQRPDLFRAVLCGFPDLDMIRFYTFRKTNNLPALLEYGDASIPEQFDFLREYSPYQAVRDGVAYPAVMLSSGDRDTRVPPLQARKMTARLQAATSSGLPVILRYHPKAGHAAGRGLPLSRRIEDLAMELTFLWTQLGAAEP